MKNFITLAISSLICLALAFPSAAQTQSGGVAWPLKVSENGHYLVDQDGTPFLLITDTGWAIRKLTNSQIVQYINDRHAKGFNTIQVYIQGEVGVLTNPDQNLFNKLKFVARELENRDMLMALTPGWFGLNSVTLLPRFKALNDAELQEYGRFFATQFIDNDNMVFIQGGDANPGKDGSVAQIKNIVEQITSGISEIKPQILNTYHTTEPDQGSGVWSSSSKWFHHDDYIQFHGTQVHVPGRGYEDIYRLALQDYKLPDPKPHVQLEIGYEGQSFEWLTTPYYIRMGALWSFLHGGCAINYGHGKIWNFSSGWQSAMNDDGAFDVTYIGKFILNYDWWKLVPDDIHEIITAGYGSFYNRGQGQEIYDYVTAAGANDRTFALAYVPSNRDITVDMGWFSSTGSLVKASWYDPSTPGTKIAISGSPFPARGSQVISMPNSNADNEEDFVLVLEATGPPIDQ